jgi:lipid-binding SYLF domain-containing protein
MMALEGGSFGLQLGGQATDFVLLVMNRRGADSILTSQVKLGGDVAAAAGPKGRNAAASDGCHHARGDSVIFAFARIVRRDLS